MASLLRLPLLPALFAISGWAVSAFSAAPLLDDPTAKENGAKRVAPKIPVGKTLVLPLSSSDADDDVLSFSVVSSSPKIMARVRTGLLRMRVHVSYLGDGAANPPAAAFSGDLDFVLFRDFTPVTAGIIGSLAQSGFYDPRQEGTETRSHLFHRVVKNFVAQMGDPNGQLPDPTLPAAALVRGPGFAFDDEFLGSLIFSGRGQLAMANGGYRQGSTFSNNTNIQLGDFGGTNGSQFFVTFDQPRSLDFKHTIFGQCVRGFDLLDKISKVPLDLQFVNPRNPTGSREQSRPTVEVQVTSVTVQPARAEAILLLSATDAVAATLQITARDASGGISSRTINVNGTRDQTNDPPLLKPIPNLITTVGVVPPITLNGVDLEHDRLIYGLATASRSTTTGAFGTAQIPATFDPSLFTGFLFPRQTAGFEDLVFGVAGSNDPRLNAPATTANPFAPFDAYRFRVAELGYGDRAVSAEPVAVEGIAGIAFTDAVLAELRDGDPAGAGTDFKVTVNWGDGSALETSAGATPKIKIERSPTTPGAFLVKGGHTYAKPGVYSVGTVLDAALGAVARTHGQAVIVADGTTLRAVGVKVANAGATLKDRVLATFTDTTPGAQPQDFSARIDWGDGKVSPGTIVAKGAGRFAVTGNHTYRDPETFAAFVHLARTTAPLAQAVAWSSVRLSGFRAPKHLPPFPAAHLVGEISQAIGSDGNAIPFVTTTGTGADAQTRFAISFLIVNTGNVTSSECGISFYLSKNETLNTTQAGTEPADIPITIGASLKEGFIPGLKAGESRSFGLVQFPTIDQRLFAPKGESGASYFLLAHLKYTDPLADQMPISRDFIAGRINGIKVNKTTLTVTEAAGAMHSKTFKVVLLGKPAQDVKIPLLLSGITEIEADKVELTFTPQNWDQPQIVTVTAKDDTTHDGTKTTNITIGPTESTDSTWDGMNGGTVTVASLDDDPAP